MSFIDRLRAASQIFRGLGDTPNNLIPDRTSGKFGLAFVSNDTAFKTSAVWGAIRLRADLVSTMPLQIKRKNPDGSVSLVDTPALQLDSIGGSLSIEEFLYSSQVDLDLTGNTFGIIRARDPQSQRATQIELVDAKSVTVQGTGGSITAYLIGSTTYDPADIWHERQFTMSGNPMGLSPLHYASAAIGQNMSAREFGLQYFQNPGIPTVHLQNTKAQLQPTQSEEIKRRFMASQETRSPFVSGNDWSLNVETISADESQFLNTLDMSAQEIVRFMGVPGDLIGINSSGVSVTYANITQRFLSFLVLNLGPTLVRRERRFSRDLLPNKVFAKFDTDELLRLDPASQVAVDATAIASRFVTPDEVRAQREMPPFTPAQLEQLKDLIAVVPVPPPTIPKIPNKPEA